MRMAEMPTGVTAVAAAEATTVLLALTLVMAIRAAEVVVVIHPAAQLAGAV
jgi:hypothetical protein